MGYSFETNCDYMKKNALGTDGLPKAIEADSKGRAMGWYNCTLQCNPLGSLETDCNQYSTAYNYSYFLSKGFLCMIRGTFDDGLEHDVLFAFTQDNKKENVDFTKNNVFKRITNADYPKASSNNFSYPVDFFKKGNFNPKYNEQIQKLSKYYCYSFYKESDGVRQAFTNYTKDDPSSNPNYSKTNRNYFNFSFKSLIPIFDLSEVDSIISYLDSGDRSGEIVPKGTDWSVYVDGKKNPLLHIYWKNKWFEKQLLKDMTPDMMTTKIWSEVPIIENGVETGDFKKISLYSGSYRPHPFDTSFKSIFKKVDPKAYNSLLDGLLNPLETRRYKICMRNEYWEKTTGQKRHTDTAFFYIDNHGEVLSSGIIEDSEPDESTITIKFGAGVNPDDTYKPIPDGSDVKDGDTASGNGSNNLGLLTTTYKLTAARLKGLGGFLWGGLIDSIKLVNNNPIENIVSCKIIPVATGGTDKNIYLGNVNTNIMGEVVTGHKKVTLGSIPVKEFYGSFLDYAPFTKISIFIPFIGFKELDTSLYMGKNISVEYIVDMITGSCKALLYANGIYCQSYDGNCGIDIPLTSNNRAQVEAAYIGGAIGTVGEIAGKDVLGALDSMLNTAVTPYHYNTSGTYSPTCGSFETRLCYLIIDRPTFQLPTSYGHDRGYPCELSRSIGSVSGYTVVDSGVDLSGISCTDNERDIIRTLLTSGFYA